MRFRYTPILLIIIAFWVSGCEKQINRSDSLVDYLPPEADLVVKFNDLAMVKQDFANNSLYNELKNPQVYDFMKSHPEFIASLQPKDQSVIAFQQRSDSTHFAVITRHHPKVILFDSLAPPMTRTYKKQPITVSDWDGLTHYSTTIDSVFIVSSSEKTIESIVDGILAEKDPLRKAFQLKQNTDLSTIFAPKVLVLDSLQIKLATQAVTSLEVLPKGVSITGVVMDKDTLPSLLSVFEGLVPQKNEIASIIPINAKQAKVMTFQDAELLSKNLNHFHGDSISIAPIFDSVIELGSITTDSGNHMVARSIDPDITQEELNSSLNELSRFREVILYEYTEENNVFNRFYPILENLTPTVLLRWEDFFIFSENEESAKNIITSIKNGAVVEKSNAYEQVLPQLSQASSFSVFNMQGQIDTWIAPFLSADEGVVPRFPLISLQFSSDHGFAHVNLVCQELNGSKKQTPGVVTQLFSKTLDAPILNGPHFFTNHRTRKKDIAVQDMQNNFYLLSETGNILWKKKLDAPILGSISEVDILRNGKKQLAFATSKTFYILDRNGNTVNPFPKKFSDPITQPLAVFDYDNKRNYRFVIVQGKEVYMYDSKGKTVTGFTFKNTQSNIVLPPQHIRMRTKDYLLIAEESGKLNILSRVGKERVRVSKTFDFSELPIAKEGNNFVIITKQHTKESISQTGKVTSLPLDVSSNYQFKILGNTKVTLDDNLLRINGKLVELPYGIYTSPKILNSNKGTYITVTETQEKKLYVIDKSGNILDGFPVYGSTRADITVVKGRLLVTTAVEEKEIAVYSL